MAGRDTEEIKTASGETFPRQRNGYSVSAVNEYIERINRKFEDTLYEYKRQIVELQRDLEEKAASAPEGIDKLLEQLGDAKNELSEANAQIKALTAERDALQEQVAQLSAEADRLRAAAENGNNLLGILNSTRENENSVSLSERQHQSEPVVEFLSIGDPDSIEFDATDGNKGSEDADIVDWPTPDNSGYNKSSDDDFTVNGNIYEITPSAETHVTPLDFASDTECRVEETLSEARSAAKKIIEETSAEANRLRNSCLSKAGEEARAIKREAYLRARLMLDRISRKLQSQFDSCLQDVTAAGIDAYRELVDQFLKLRVALDDLSFTASDSSSQILEKFCSDTNDIENA